MTDNITNLPSMNNLGNPIFRRMMRRAILENRRMPQLDLPEQTVGKVISFRRMANIPRIGKEDAVDGTP